MFKIKIVSEAQQKLAQARADNSILRQQLSSYGRIIDYQAQTITALQNKIRFLENISDIDNNLDYPNNRKEI